MQIRAAVITTQNNQVLRQGGPRSTVKMQNVQEFLHYVDGKINNQILSATSDYYMLKAKYNWEQRETDFAIQIKAAINLRQN